VNRAHGRLQVGPVCQLADARTRDGPRGRELPCGLTAWSLEMGRAEKKQPRRRLLIFLFLFCIFLFYFLFEISILNSKLFVSFIPELKA
jgi:hypothetical protein